MKKNPSQKKQTKKQIQPLEILFKKNPRWNLVGGGVNFNPEASIKMARPNSG